MPIANPNTYLSEITGICNQHWPDNRTVNIACHGHSVPAGYFATPMVDTFNAYPHLLHYGLKKRFPFAVINVIVTAIGGEASDTGAARFADDVLNHRPDVITIDYGLNDRGMNLKRAHACWSQMIKAGLAANAKIILLTPTPDITQLQENSAANDTLLAKHAQQIRRLAEEYNVGLADSFTACMEYACQNALSDILAWRNHPNRQGHELVAKELLRWFPVAELPEGADISAR